MSQYGLIHAPTWYQQALMWLVTKAGVPLPREHIAGPSFTPNTEVTPGYAVIKSMSAYAAVPWIYAVVRAVSSDLAGLPLILMRGDERVDVHPFLDLIAQPSTRISQRQYRQQVTTDRMLEGNSYTLMLAPGGPRTIPTSLLRLHPEHIAIESATDGQPETYVWNSFSSRREYTWQQVVHVRGASWEGSSEGQFGQGLIRALNDYLNADVAAWRRQSDSNKVGRPDAVLSPSGTDPSMVRWTRKQIQEITEGVQRLFKAANGGIVVLPESMQIDTLSWSPSEMAFPETHKLVREAVIGTSGVPPARVGLETANYATAREQLRIYWDSTVRGFAREFEDGYNEIARCFEDGLTVHHDFSAVAALQFDRTERVARVVNLWNIGVSLEEALRAEGLEDINVDGATTTPAPPPDEPTEEDEERARQFKQWWGAHPLALENREPDSDVLTASFTVPVTEIERATVWRDFVSELHGPGEKQFAIVLRDFFREASRRYGIRLRDELSGRPLGTRIDSVTLARILRADLEDAELSNAMGPSIKKRIELAFAKAMRQMALNLPLESSRSPVTTFTAELVTRVNATTRDAIRSVIVDGLADGASIGEMRTTLQASRAFSGSRSLTIARTETTRAVNAGANTAYQTAKDAGVNVKKQWLTARDTDVRDEHVDIDGETVGVDETFETDGATARYPGDFGVPELDINCRCTVVPVVERA